MTSANQNEARRRNRRGGLALALTACALSLGGGLALGGVGERPAASAPRPGPVALGEPRGRGAVDRPLGRRGCRPNCRGRACGSDGCGGSCGTCGADRACVKSRCVGAPKGDPCKAMTGRWSGLMPSTGTHAAQYLKGRIWGTQKACRARFSVTFRSGSRQAEVVEYFDVALSGTRRARKASFTCTRLVYGKNARSYSKDNFSGTLDLSLTLFKGKVLDASGATGAIILRKR